MLRSGGGDAQMCVLAGRRASPGADAAPGSGPEADETL